MPASTPTAVQNVPVTPDEAGMRVDRFLEARFPGLSFSHIQRVIRKGQLRVNGKRTEPKNRLEAGQTVRIPPLRLDAPKQPRAPGNEADEKTRAFLKSITLYEDADVLVFNKPMGLAVQGGSGTTRHLDGMLEVLRDAHGQRPRLVHRLDKDTAGCLLVAKTRFAAAALAKTFRSRSARKVYWALVAGVPKVQQGRVSTFLAKEEREDESIMRIARHGEKGASHAVTYYAVVDTSGPLLAWLSLKPVTGRTHQLRAHMAHIGHPIVGDPKYFSIENWELPGGMQNKLHLLARRIVVPHPRGGAIDASAPLPPHMQQSWNLLGLDASRYDPIEEAAGELKRIGNCRPGLKVELEVQRPVKDQCAHALSSASGADLHPVSERDGHAGAQDYPGFPYTIMAPAHGAAAHHRVEMSKRAAPLHHQVRRNIAVARGSSGSVLPTPLPRTPLIPPEGGGAAVGSCRAAGAGHRPPCPVSPIPYPICRTAPRRFRTAPRAASCSRAFMACPAAPARNTWAPACNSSRPDAPPRRLFICLDRQPNGCILSSWMRCSKRWPTRADENCSTGCAPRTGRRSANCARAST